jgi:ABC-type multidrug transport system ATPase subunit
MPLLRMREATFAGAGVCVGPVTLDLEDGERAALTCESARDAEVVALMATGVVKSSSGRVLIGDFDPHVQSVACKRISALVPHEPFTLDENEFARYVAYRAALWNVELTHAWMQVELFQKRLTGMHEAFAYPLIAALIGTPKLIVLDRPQPAYAAAILDAIGSRTMLSTHTDVASACAFAPRGSGRLASMLS